MDLLTAPDGPSDIWHVSSRPQKTRASFPPFTIKIIEGVEPLGRQLGVDAKRSVPEALRDLLFGGPLPTIEETGKEIDEKVRGAPTHTYAILDAAKVQGLPEMLASSGLQHRCLFKDNAYRQLGDVAPWIVQLDEASDFCRHLFTEGEAPWQMWDRGPGIYVRSRASLDELWRHFRKFTRIQDESGKWLYFRFYDPDCVAATESLIRAVNSSVQQTLSFPVLLVVAGPNVKKLRPGDGEDGEI